MGDSGASIPITTVQWSCFQVLYGDSEFGIPQTNFFRYLQLRHALQLQSRYTLLQLIDHAIVQGILMEKETKGMISRGYSIILNVLRDPAGLPCKHKWEEDVGPLDGETWSLCLASAPAMSVSASQKLSHLYQLHRAYRTPVKLHKWGICDTPLCPECMRDHGDLMHMFWKCPKLFWYWSEILEIISQVFTFTIPKSPIVCLSGALDEESLTPSTHTAIIQLLYVA